jgi:hypothetical protein
MGGMMNAYKTLDDNLNEETTRRSRCRWKYNIRMNLREIQWKFVDWMHLTENRGQLWALANTVMNFRFYKRWIIL